MHDKFHPSIPLKSFAIKFKRWGQDLYRVEHDYTIKNISKSHHIYIAEKSSSQINTYLYVFQQINYYSFFNIPINFSLHCIQKRFLSQQ